MEPAPFLTLLTAHGLPGLIIALLIVWVYRKDQELTAERNARINDAKAYTDLALKLQGEALASVHKLAQIFEEIRRDRDRSATLQEQLVSATHQLNTFTDGVLDRLKGD